jgi:hypothetical protein
MSNTTNYCQAHIHKVFKNYEYLRDSTSISDKSLNLSLLFDPIYDYLALQARTFMLNFKGHGYINFFKTLRVPEKDVKQLLYEAYIYSFFVAVYNALYYDRVSGQCELGYILEGHAALFDVLRSPTISGMKDSTYLSYNINLGGEDGRKAIVVGLLAKFPFLKEYRKTNLNDFGTFAFRIPKYDEVYNRLVEDYYSRDHIQQGERDDDKPHPRAVGLEYTRGKLHVTNLKTKNTSTILTFNNNPVMNSFYSSDRKSFYFVPVNNGRAIENNASVFFSKANFIKLDSLENDMVKINRTYSIVPDDNQLAHTVCSEVFTNTGIKCEFFPSDKPKSKYNVPDFNKTLDLIKTLERSGIEKVVEFISDIEFEDFESFVDDYLQSLVKSENLE